MLAVQRGLSVLIGIIAGQGKADGNMQWQYAGGRNARFAYLLRSGPADWCHRACFPHYTASHHHMITYVGLEDRHQILGQMKVDGDILMHKCLVHNLLYNGMTKKCAWPDRYRYGILPV